MENLDVRVQKFIENYLPNPLPCLGDLGRVGQDQLKGMLKEAGYQTLAGFFSPYQRIAVNKETGKAQIDIFDTQDVIKKSPGFSYVGLKSLDELGDYLDGRKTRFKNFKGDNSDASYKGFFAGFIGGGIVDAFGYSIFSDGKELSGWLLAPPLIIGIGTWVYHHFLEKNEDKKLQKNIDNFLGTYQSRIATGKEAIMKALTPENKKSEEPLRDYP